MTHATTWFEIPTVDFERAVKFYGEVLGRPLHTGLHPDGSEVGPEGERMAMFNDPSNTAEVNGAVVFTKNQKPLRDGTVVYLSVEGDLNAALNRVESSGGKVLTPKAAIGGGMGYWAHFEDTEGNRVGLMSME